MLTEQLSAECSARGIRLVALDPLQGIAEQLEQGGVCGGGQRAAILHKHRDESKLLKQLCTSFERAFVLATTSSQVRPQAESSAPHARLSRVRPMPG